MGAIEAVEKEGSRGSGGGGGHGAGTMPQVGLGCSGVRGGCLLPRRPARARSYRTGRSSGSGSGAVRVLGRVHSAYLRRA
jgi:hypothetical protein